MSLAYLVDLICVAVMRVNSVGCLRWIWLYSEPSGMIYIHDNRKRLNKLDATVVILAIVYSLIHAFIGGMNMLILEGFGPVNIGQDQLTVTIFILIISVIPSCFTFCYSALAVVNLWRHRNSDRWIILKPSSEGLIHGSYEPISRIRLLKRILSVAIAALLLSRTSILFLFELPTTIEMLPVLSRPISDILRIQRTVYSWSQDGLQVLVQLPSPSEIIQVPQEYAYQIIITRYIAGLHLLVFWGLGRKAREPYIRGIHWLLSASGIFGITRHMKQYIQAIYRPTINSDSENIIVPYRTPDVSLCRFHSPTRNETAAPSRLALGIDSQTSATSSCRTPADKVEKPIKAPYSVKNYPLSPTAAVVDKLGSAYPGRSETPPPPYLGHNAMPCHDSKMI
ncbi:SubName: Full=Uncharacterized protein {ECO:0000313/EMBL:CCA67992.1} [Serendipita indica DSM 11827]|nr:SubName: Full=Uncharacterized protein {ECO:0000313/EMBL:CCA67992.1} [Serendipita indica DSM 11827]